MPSLSKALAPAPTYPEKVLQFGTGVLLRGLVDTLIDQANRQGTFNGSVVVVKSTDADVSAFSAQDGRFTVSIRSEEGTENHVVSAISRVLSAQTDWRAVLDVAKNPALQVIVSNTTEVGLNYLEESIFQQPPQSFPAKLTAFLYERFRNYGGSKRHGLVVVPTELWPDNGLRLRDAVEKLAKHNDLGKLFTKWLKYHVRFCNSLVDRIVVAADDVQRSVFAKEAGYDDALLTITEPYALWAIEGDDRVRQVLTFAEASPEQVIIEEDVAFYRERKLRVLNGSHTLSVPLAYLLGYETVFEANEDPAFRAFLEKLIHEEIVPTVPTDALGDEEGRAAVQQFADDVLKRFRNPQLEHLLLKITFQQTAKMQARNVPTLLRYVEKFGAVPPTMAVGFASYLRFLKPERQDEEGTWLGEVAIGGGELVYPIRDDRAADFAEHWRSVDVTNATSVRAFVTAVNADTSLWQENLDALPGWTDAVANVLSKILNEGVGAVLEEK